jgi:signal transduction histidine kinase
LGEISQERTANLQRLQVISLALSIIVFVFMVVRVTLSLRKQDGIITERTMEVIKQRDTIAEEKSRIEQLLSDLKTTQSQLIQSEKMASLGQMVAGVAHEVNTPLGFVKSNLEIVDRNQQILAQTLSEYIKLGDTLQSDDVDNLALQLDKAKSASERILQYDITGKTKKLISSALTGVDRIQELVLNLKNFSRLDESSVKEADINEGIESALMIAQNVIKHKATVETNYAPNLRAECYPAQLNQVFLNLLTNAAQAIEQDESDQSGVLKGKIQIATAHEKETVVIKISDNGKGIPPENLKKIFEPFFTTKPIGQGTGLGLSIVYKIIEKHQGEILVDSAVGKGSTFTIRIPKRLNLAQQSLNLIK